MHFKKNWSENQRFILQEIRNQKGIEMTVSLPINTSCFRFLEKSKKLCFFSTLVWKCQEAPGSTLASIKFWIKSELLLLQDVTELTVAAREVIEPHSHRVFPALAGASGDRPERIYGCVSN